MRRLRAADDLVVTHDGHLVTIASQRWEPGTFLYDVAFLELDIVDEGAQLAVTAWHAGRYAPHQLLRFPVPAALGGQLRALVEDVAEARAELA